MSLDRWIALVLISIFVVYGYTAFFLMDDFHSIDIDTQDYWNIAEAYLEKKLNDNLLL